MTPARTPPPTPPIWAEQYRNRETGKYYTPHNDDERIFVSSDTPRRCLCKGGEGSGKSVAGIIKNLGRVRRGMHGAMVSPDLQHFKKSLWPEFRRWCPWDMVVPSQRNRGEAHWEPGHTFTMNFISGGSMICGGIEDPSSFEGPNLHFAHFDEARRHSTPQALKVLDGRVRLAGPNGEPPQFYMTTTPRKHWLFEYCGPITDNDALADFKRSLMVITLKTSDNEAAGNIASGYTVQRAQSLTEHEKRVILDADWEDESDADNFLPYMSMWDALQIPPVAGLTGGVYGLDIGTDNDKAALLGAAMWQGRVVQHHAQTWSPRINPASTMSHDPTRARIDLMEVEAAVMDLKRERPLAVFYDPYQAELMAARCRKAGLTMIPVNQGNDRVEADSLLWQLIQSRELAHYGDAEVRQHIGNANKKFVDSERKKLRLVKRTPSGKIDLAVALSQAAWGLKFKFKFSPEDVAGGNLGTKFKSKW